MSTTRRAPDRVSPFLVPMMMANAGAANVSMRCRLARAVRDHRAPPAPPAPTPSPPPPAWWPSGRCDVAIGGGAEAAIQPVAIAAFANMTALSSSGDLPALRRPPRRVRHRPRAPARLVLEDWDRAVARGARIYAEIAGAASTADAHHITAPAPDGRRGGRLHGAGPRRRRARSRPTSATSTPTAPPPRSTTWPRPGPSTRCSASPGPPVTSTKGVTGHGLGGRRGHRGRGLGAHHRPRPDPADRRLRAARPRDPPRRGRGTARPWEPGPVLSNSFGFGGHNGCLVLVPASA